MRAATRFYESWIVPKAHRPFFEHVDETEKVGLADALRTLLSRLGKGLGDVPFNYFIHTTPCHEHFAGIFHWHLELLPKLSIAAGFELGSGVMINTLTPEQAAEFLRSVPA